MSESSNELYSPAKIIKFRIDVPDLNAEMKTSNKPLNPNDIPIIVTSASELAPKIIAISTKKEQNIFQSEIATFKMDQFSNKAWNCINTQDLTITNPTETQINFNRNVFKALESLK